MTIEDYCISLNPNNFFLVVLGVVDMYHNLLKVLDYLTTLYWVLGLARIKQGAIERILSFFMMDIGEYHADIQRNCKAISPDVRSTEGDIARQFR